MPRNIVKSRLNSSQATNPATRRPSTVQHAIMPGSMLQAYNICSQEPVPSPSLDYVQMYPDTSDDPYDSYSYSSDAKGYFVGEQEGIKVEYIGSSSLDDSDRDRRRRRTSLAKEKEVLSNMHMRRRAQNRASQRAFRDRKDKHVKDLEHQLEDLGSRHQELLTSYSNLSSMNDRLSGELEKLMTENGSLRSSRDSSTFSALLTPKELDGLGGTDDFYSESVFYYGSELSGADRLLDACDGTL